MGEGLARRTAVQDRGRSRDQLLYRRNSLYASPRSAEFVGAIPLEVIVSAKIACVIPRRWTLEDYAQHTCSDHSHAHLSRVELADNLRNGLVELVRAEDGRLPQKIIVRQVRTLTARGLSCTVGEGLVVMLRRENERAVALVMLAHIRMRREAPAT
ncbi:MAG: hypothetical protein ACLP1Y_09375 [Candidatus Acidiferrales bacterium]